MAELHPEAIPTIRRDRPDLDDLPDEALAKLSLAQFVSLRLHMRDLGRVSRDDLKRLRDFIRKATGR